jgi:flagellar protein FlaG
MMRIEKGLSFNPPLEKASPASILPSEPKNRPEEVKINDKQSVHDHNFLDEVHEALRQANRATEAVNVSLRFKLHEDSNRFMVQVVNNQENEVIKEIPPEKILDLIARIQDMIGLLVNEKR